MSVWLVLRLIGVAVGIVTILGFVSGYLNVEFKPYFASLLKVLQVVANVVVGAELWEMLLDWLRLHFAWMPKPEAHWKPIYTLSALVMLSLGRRLQAWYAIPLALVCSLIPAVFAGTMPVGSLGVIVWPVVGFCLFYGVPPLMRGNWHDALARAAFAAAVGLFVTYSYTTLIPGESRLVVLAILVGIGGLFFLVRGLMQFEILKASPNPRTLMSTPSAAAGLDITATLGGALALGYLFAA